MATKKVKVAYKEPSDYFSPKALAVFDEGKKSTAKKATPKKTNTKKK